jgi:hypothetical protein
MKRIIGPILAAGTALGVTAVVVPPAGADSNAPTTGGGGSNAVFVQTDSTTGNQVVAYQRAADGTLTLAGTYDTGGLGGVLNGSVVDHLASQGSLTSDPAGGLLYAVNAGSNTLSVFSVSGDTLTLEQVVGSGGKFPVSVAVRGNLVYVLNALDGGSIQGFTWSGGSLVPLAGSNRNLGLTIPTDKTQYTHTPGQVAFSPDGTALVVTTKASSNAIDVFRVGPFGLPSTAPVVNSEPGTVPFAVDFDAAGHLVVANAGTNALATFTLRPNGTTTPIDAVGTGAMATCWVTSARGYLYASNAGSASVSTFVTSAPGALSLEGSTTTDPGTVDAASTVYGRYLYVQTGGNGIVDGFRVRPDGSLAPVGQVTVPAAVGGEGIVAF